MGLQKFGDARSSSEPAQKTAAADQPERDEESQQRLAALQQENEEVDR